MITATYISDVNQNNGYGQGCQVKMVCSATANRSSNSSTVNVKIYLVAPKSVSLFEDVRGVLFDGGDSFEDIDFTIDSKTYAKGEHLLFETDLEIGHTKSTSFLDGEGWFEGWVTIYDLWDEDEYPPEDYNWSTYISCGPRTHYKSSNEGGMFLGYINNAVASCSATYLGDNMAITITDNMSSSENIPHRYAISYKFGSYEGWIVKPESLTRKGVIYWQIPFDFLSEFTANEASKKGTITVVGYHCPFNSWMDNPNEEYGYSKDDAIIIPGSYGSQDEYYLMTSDAGTFSVEFTALLDVDISGPTINPTVTDTNSTTVALTGNNKSLVRYFSNAYIDAGAKAQSGATLDSTLIIWGNKKIYSNTGTIEKVETKDFTIQAVDSRGLTSYYQGAVSTFVEYDKLTCNIFPNAIDTDGNLTFNIEGVYYYGSFGATTNTLTLKYRYRTQEGSYGSWTNVTVTPGAYGGYAVTINLSGLNYKEIYYFEAQAVDKLMTVNSAETLIASYPVFDWSKTDFNFNVPVSAQGDFTFAPDAGIYGEGQDGGVSALIPLDSTGNTVLGFGVYTKETGSTKIYGSSIDLIAHQDITINGESFLGLINAMTNAYSFTPTITEGANFGSASCALTLRGNCLYCRVYGSRIAASGTGDFTDELIAKIEFNHGGKITEMDYVNGIAGTSGPTAALSMANVSVNGEIASFDMMLSNSSAAARNFLASFVIPVSINPAAFL